MNGIVVKFKARLANEFVRMRKYIENEQKRSEETKESNKKNRLQETDVIKELVEYAKGQGSTHSDRLYIVYTKLAKKVVGGKPTTFFCYSSKVFLHFYLSYHLVLILHKNYSHKLLNLHYLSK